MELVEVRRCVRLPMRQRLPRHQYRGHLSQCFRCQTGETGETFLLAALRTENMGPCSTPSKAPQDGAGQRPYKPKQSPPDAMPSGGRFDRETRTSLSRRRQCLRQCVRKHQRLQRSVCQPNKTLRGTQHR